MNFAETSSSTVVFAHQQPTLVAVQLFRETPVRVTCQYCGSDVFTSTMYETGTITWLACAITAFVGYVFCSLLVNFYTSHNQITNQHALIIYVTEIGSEEKQPKHLTL